MKRKCANCGAVLRVSHCKPGHNHASRERISGCSVCGAPPFNSLLGVRK